MEPSSGLSEKDFIQDDIPKDPRPYWAWVIVLSLLVSFVFAISTWLPKKLSEQYANDPFLQVTNREFSLFLWQFPEYMRFNAKAKMGYLPAFDYKDASLDPELADKYVVAPPEIVFLFHTWDRFLRPDLILKAIPLDEFREFLKQNEMWQPQHWPAAPPLYRSFIDQLHLLSPDQDLRFIPEKFLPKIVKESFSGWKNFFYEGNAINELAPSYLQLEAFLNRFPHYARNYWRNILIHSYPNYLKDFSTGHYTPESMVPASQLAPFLKVELYNYIHQ